MAEIDLDGKKVTVPDGSMVMHAADAAGAAASGIAAVVAELRG